MTVLQTSLYYESIWHYKPASEQIYWLFTSRCCYDTFCYIDGKYLDCFTFIMPVCRTICIRNKHEKAWFGKKHQRIYGLLEKPWEHSYSTNVYTGHHRTFGLNYSKLWKCCTGRNHDPWLKIVYFYIVANRHCMPVALGFHTIHEKIPMLSHLHEY